MKFTIYLTAILLINTVFAGEIVATRNFGYIENVARELDTDSLVLFDVDGTLILPRDAILQPKNKGLFYQLTVKHTERDLFREIRMKAPHELVDKRSIDLVRQLEIQKIPTIALTAAPAKVHGGGEMGIWRVEELKKYGFDFSSAFPMLPCIELPSDVNYQHLPLFKSGVLYSSFHPKGDILVAFLQKLARKPNKILFVDDELIHVQSVVAALEELGIPCHGIHYTAAADAPCIFNPNFAQFQIDYFVAHDVWLEDKDCEQLWIISNAESL